MALDTEVGGADAESYVSVEDFKARADALGQPYGPDSPPDPIEQALRRATAYIDGHYRGRWTGVKATSTQALAWPRIDAVDEDGNDIDDDVIPRAVVAATCQAAIREIASPGSLAPDLDRGGAVKSVTNQVGPISESVTYQDSAPSRVQLTVIDDLLAGLLRRGGGSVGFLERA
jgi:hypothetical protein